MHVADECGNVEAVGIDHSRHMIEAANRNKGDRRAVQFHEMSATAMTFDDATFDVVSAIQTAHHWRQPDVITARCIGCWWAEDGASCTKPTGTQRCPTAEFTGPRASQPMRRC